jgi:hypothetical protein
VLASAADAAALAGAVLASAADAAALAAGAALAGAVLAPGLLQAASASPATRVRESNLFIGLVTPPRLIGILDVRSCERFRVPWRTRPAVGTNVLDAAVR